MTDAGKPSADPIRVVVFAGGPTLRRGVREFLNLLERNEAIELCACYCQSADPTPIGVLRDLVRRRGLLAVPLAIAEAASFLMFALTQPPAARAARRLPAELGERLRFVPDIHGAEVLASVGELRPDLGLIYGSPILKPQLFEIPRLGTLGIHHGKVPEYRGKKTTFWAVYNGDKQVGVTIQKVGRGLDTGAVVREGCVDVSRRPFWRIWRELELKGFEEYVGAISDVQRGVERLRPQAGPRGKLYRDPKLRDLARFWLRHIRSLLWPKA